MRAMLLCATIGMALLPRLAGEYVPPKAEAPDSVIKLTKFNFDQAKQGTWFVKFFAPWCVHCQRLAPVWSKLAQMAESSEWPVRIAEVDCTRSEEICKTIGVQGYPTLALMVEGEKIGEYRGKSAPQDMEDWISKELGISQPLGKSDGKPSAEAKAPKAPGRAPPLRPGEQTMKETIEKSAALQVYIDDGLWGLLAHGVINFPTRHKVVNVYIYGAILYFGVAALIYHLWMEAKKEMESERDATRAGADQPAGQ